MLRQKKPRLLYNWSVPIHLLNRLYNKQVKFDLFMFFAIAWKGRRRDRSSDREPQVRPLHREAGRDDQPVGRLQGLEWRQWWSRSRYIQPKTVQLPNESGVFLPKIPFHMIIFVFILSRSKRKVLSHHTAVSVRVSLVQSRISSAVSKITAQKATVLFHSLSSLLLHEENSPVDVARDDIQCCHSYIRGYFSA